MTDARQRAALLGCWTGTSHRSRSAARSPNIDFTKEGAGERHVVRIGNDIPVHGVERTSELAATRTA